MAQPLPRSPRNFHPQKNQRMAVEAVAEDRVRERLLRKKVGAEGLVLPLRLLPPFALPVLRRREEGEGRAWVEQSLRLLEWGASRERLLRKKVGAEGLVLPLRLLPPFALPVLRRREEGEGRAWVEQSLRLLEWGASRERLLRKKVVGEDLVLPLRLLPPFALPVLRKRGEGEGQAWVERSLRLREWGASQERLLRKKVVGEG